MTPNSTTGVLILIILGCFLFERTYTISDSQQNNCNTRCKVKRAASGSLTEQKSSDGIHNLCMCYLKNGARERFYCMNDDGTTKTSCRLMPNPPPTVQPGATTNCNSKCKAKRALSGSFIVFNGTNGISHNLCMCDFRNRGRERLYCLNDDGSTKLSCRPDPAGSPNAQPIPISPNYNEQTATSASADEMVNSGEPVNTRGSKLWIGCDRFCVEKSADRGIASRQKTDNGTIYTECLCYFHGGRYERLPCVNRDGSTKVTCTPMQPTDAPIIQPKLKGPAYVMVPKSLSEVCNNYCKVVRPRASGTMEKTTECWCIAENNDRLFGFRTS